MREIDRTIVSALLFSKDGKLFQAQKDPTKGGVYVDCWHIPGGGVEKDEDMVGAVVREIQEETGIDVHGLPISLIDDVGRGTSEKTLADGERVRCHMRFYIYRIDLPTETTETTVTLGDEFVSYRWSDLSELGKLTLTPPSIELFTRLGYLQN